MPRKPLPPRIASRKACLPSADMGGCLVVAGLRQVARGLEGEGVPLADLVGVEQPAVLRGDDLEAVLLADLGQDPLGQAELAVLAGDDRVLEPGALGEEENLLRAPLLAARARPIAPGAISAAPAARSIWRRFNVMVRISSMIRSRPARPGPGRASSGGVRRILTDSDSPRRRKNPDRPDSPQASVPPGPKSSRHRANRPYVDATSRRPGSSGERCIALAGEPKYG